MTPNPYAEAASRWFRIVLGVAGFALSAVVVWLTLSAGATEGCFGRVCTSSRIWTAQDDPAQFWFYVLFWAAFAAFFARVAWKAWRD